MPRYKVSSRMKILLPVYVAIYVYLQSPNVTCVETQENIEGIKDSSLIISGTSADEFLIESRSRSNEELETTEPNPAASSSINSGHVYTNSIEPPYHFWNTSDSDGNCEEHISQDVEKVWIPHVLPAKLANFRPKSKVNELCNQQSDLFERSLRNLTLWAIQMKEASASSTAGMLLGEHYHFGHYDECIAIHNPSISGRYCLAQIKFTVAKNAYPVSNTKERETASPYADVLDHFAKTDNKWCGLESDTINWGICVPAACSRQDVEESLIETLSDINHKHGIDLTINLFETSCSSAIDDQSLPFFSKAALYFLASLSSLSIITTLYHLLSDDETLHSEGSLTRKILMSFSIVNNLRSLTRSSGKETLNSLDALKFYLMLMIMTIHRMWFLLHLSLHNPPNDGMESGSGIFDTVDGFFTISGFLFFRNWYAPIKKDGIKRIPSIFVNRWFRLMPSHLALILFMGFLPYLSSGPLWKQFILAEASKCQHYGWRNVLGINNIIADEDGLHHVCLLHTWYVSADLQLVLVGGLFVYLLSRNEATKLKVSLATLAVSIMVPFSIVYMNNYAGYTRHRKEFKSLIDLEKSNELLYVYPTSWYRAGPYIVGIIAGLLFSKIKAAKWNLPTPARWLILLVATALLVGAEYCVTLIASPNIDFSRLTHAAFAALHKHILGIVAATFIVVQLGWGFGKHIDQFLTHNIYVPLSRLSYLIYLIHPGWQLISTASSRSSLNPTVWNLTGLLAGDFLMSLLGALWLYFIIEGPFSSIRTTFTRRRPNGKQLQTEAEQEQHNLNTKNK